MTRFVSPPAGALVVSPVSEPNPFTVALLPWGDLWEDFLDSLGVSFEQFRDEFVGSWIFGYAAALQCAGTHTVIFCFSARIKEPWRFVHKPTDATICILPASKAYIAARSRAASWAEIRSENTSDPGRRLLRAAARYVDYLNTPVLRLARALRREGCNAILCQEYDYARFGVCVLLGRLLHLPVFASFQGGEEATSRFERLLRSLAIQQCAGLIIAAEDEAHRVHIRYNAPYAKIARIFNPVDAAQWQPIDPGAARGALHIPSDTKVVAWHGRVDIAQKGLDILLEAWLRVVRARPDEALMLLLVGTGSDAIEFRRLMQDMHGQGVVWIDEFVHDRNRLRQYLSAADVYTLPSRAEGFPVSPVEAMACGLPIVAADAAGISDILEGGELSGGIIVDRNDPDALARGVLRLLDDESLRHELGTRARQRVELRFAPDAIGAQLQRFLTNPAVEPGDQVAVRPRSSGAPLTLHSLVPPSVTTGGRFNVQPDGQSALSLVVDNATRATQVMVGTTGLRTVYNSPRSLSAIVPKHLLKAPCSHRTWLSDGGRVSNSIEFVVIAPEPPAVRRLHPARTLTLHGFNVQADGRSALAVETSGAAPDTVIVFAGIELETVHANGGMLTACVPTDLWHRPGSYDVRVRSNGRLSEPVEFIVEPETAPERGTE